jgi:alginate O-acetyltransferase complex protein AlgI
MLFNSFEFLLFFPLVIFLYFALPYRWRWVLLLAASYYFYMSWKAEYILLIVASTLIDYFAAGRMANLPDKKSRRPYLYLSLLSNLGILFGFKYFNFFRDNVNLVSDQFNLFVQLPELQVLLPVGISFYTFQTLSYTIDVYNDKMKPERHLGIFAVYVAFFPQLVAGPIERAPHLLPQFRQSFAFDYNRVRQGLMLMLWGFFKKVVIADRLADYVNQVYKPERLDEVMAQGALMREGLTHLVATYAFAFQIYCDFSGYSDIAIGSAVVMGYRLMQNFRRPYFADSVREFWQRWHVSLSTWFRDYVYIPLGGNRAIKWRWWYNLFITFLISGLWHGASWNFVIWGAIHGGLLVIGLWTAGLRQGFWSRTGLGGFPGLRRIVEVVVVFHLVIVAWVFFRAKSLPDALAVVRSFAGIGPAGLKGLSQSLQSFGMLEVLVAVGTIGLMETVHFLQERGWKMRDRITGLPLVLRWGVYVSATLLIVLFGKFSTQGEFIYFQF